MKHSIKFFLSLLIQLSLVATWGPESFGQAFGDLNKRIIPQPPNVAALMKFNEVPINYFNGTADVSIPLFQVKEGSIDLPLSLSYHTGGIKVNEEAGWTGLGWNLNIGGCIQEIIVGEPDYEQHGFNMANYGPAPKPNPPPGVPWTSSSDTYNVSEAGFCYPDSTGLIKSFRTPLDLSQGGNVPANFEYDLYSFNFAGLSGKFIFPDFQNGLCLDKQNIVFQKENLIGVNNTGIKAITPDGTQYFFEVIGITSTPRMCNTSNLFTQPIQSRTYYLSRIIYPDKRQVTLTYTKTSSRTLPSVDENWSYTLYDNLNYPLTTSLNAGQYNATQNYSTVDNYYLSGIQFDDGSLTFYTSPRRDMENAMELDSLCLYSATSAVPVKQVNFTYDYYTGIASSGDWTSSFLWNNSMNCPGAYYLPDANFTNYKSLRLRLLGVQFVDIAKAKTAYTYTLGYDASPLPYKTSLAQDLWGYQNGWTNTSSLPDYNNLGYWDSNIPYNDLANISFPSYNVTPGNRSANANVKNGMLNKITYPTGGYSVITYENNTAVNTNPAVLTSVINATADATDYSAGIQQTVFNVPDIGYKATYFDPVQGVQVINAPANPATINLTLWCCQGNVYCASQGTACGIYDPNHPTLGLYAYVESYNANSNTWTIIPTLKFDLSSTYFNNNNNPTGILSLQQPLAPGTYRLTASFPDNAPNPGSIDGAKAEITVKYKNLQQNNNPGVISAGGARVKSIVEYDQNNALATQRNFAYSRGKLMSFPLFYRTYTPFNNYTVMLSATCADDQVNEGVNCTGGVASNGIISGFIGCPYVSYTQFSLYSNPVMPYSYSAKGAVIGYDTVTITYDNNGANGKSEYIYNCQPDEYSSYNGAISPGIPTTPYLQNGSLMKVTEYKSANQAFLPVKSTSYQYTYSTDTKWCFKSEYHNLYVWTCTNFHVVEGNEFCDGFGLTTSQKFEIPQMILNFYPIKFGKLLTAQKTETLFDGSNAMPVQTSYDYNPIYQLRHTTILNSLGKAKATETWYPADYTSTGDILQEMRNRNMLDYPIETISRINGLASAGSYNLYSLQNGLVTPAIAYSFNTASPVALNASAPGNLMDSRYLPEAAFTFDANGNMRAAQKVSGPKKSYIWDYDKLYPIAEITNADTGFVAYTSFEADGTGGFTLSNPAGIITTGAITGSRAYSLSSGTISKSGLIPSSAYILSYWTQNAGAFAITGTQGQPLTGKTINGWTYFEHKISGVSQVLLPQTPGLVDELRLYPSAAQMTTYTYAPLIGMTSQCDVDNRISYYSYDGMGRLKTIKDQDGNIIKTYDYHYIHQPF